MQEVVASRRRSSAIDRCIDYVLWAAQICRPIELEFIGDQLTVGACIAETTNKTIKPGITTSNIQLPTTTFNNNDIISNNNNNNNNIKKTSKNNIIINNNNSFLYNNILHSTSNTIQQQHSTTTFNNTNSIQLSTFNNY